MEQFFYLHDVNFWLSCFGPSFRYNLVTIGVLEFVVVIDVYAQPTREKIKFYRTASNRSRPEGRHRSASAHDQGTVRTTDAGRRRRKLKWYESWGRGFGSRSGHHRPRQMARSGIHDHDRVGQDQ